MNLHVFNLFIIIFNTVSDIVLGWGPKYLLVLLAKSLRSIRGPASALLRDSGDCSAPRSEEAGKSKHGKITVTRSRTNQIRFRMSMGMVMRKLF